VTGTESQNPLDGFIRSSKVAVIGFGKTGEAVLDFILEGYGEKKICIYDDDRIIDEKKRKRYEKSGVKFLQGEQGFLELKEADFIIISPGVDGRHSRFNEIRNLRIPLVSEIEFAAGFIKSNIIAVTGTNGKSTTVSLIHHFLSQNGLDAVLAGNIGNPLISEVNRVGSSTQVVLEVSSFQLEEIVRFRPHIAVILNVTPDHLDRYSDFNDYLSAKLRISENQNLDDVLIFNHDDHMLGRCIRTRAKKIRFSTVSKLDEGFYIEDGWVTGKTGSKTERISLKNNPLRGIHNLENLLAAIIVARLAGISVRNIEQTMAGFKGLPHRIELLGKIGNIEYINDSKATNVDAALKSLVSFDSRVVLILGGKDKGGDFSVLLDAIDKRAKRVLLIGKAAGTIYKQLSRFSDRLDFVRDLAEAVRKGHEVLGDSGGVVLLAPGCASFDMFENFEHRGDVFRQEFLAFKQEIENG
jgi:UDP-N-acetylmuramoylalanine--D-glutamate ligase